MSLNISVSMKHYHLLVQSYRATPNHSMIFTCRNAPHKSKQWMSDMHYYLLIKTEHYYLEKFRLMNPNVSFATEHTSH